jgi:hypothetical protein
MFEGCVTVIYAALVLGISVLALFRLYHFSSLWSLMLCITLCLYVSVLLVLTTPGACSGTLSQVVTYK